MAFNFGSFAASADAPITFGKRELAAGRYTFRLDEIANGKSQAGAEKYEAKFTVVAQANGGADMVGISRKQHFVVGHSKDSVAKAYQAQLAHLLKISGVDLTKITNEGELIMACKAMATRNPLSVWDVKPQEKDPQYLDWTYVGLPTAATATETPAQVAPAAPATPAPSTAVEDDLFR